MIVTTKFSKFKSSRNKLSRINYSKIKLGGWSLQSLTSGVLLKYHIDHIKSLLNRILKREIGYKVYFNYNLNYAKTNKPLETRMGGGKSIIVSLGTNINPGLIFLETYNVKFDFIYSIFIDLKNKLPFNIRLIRLND